MADNPQKLLYKMLAESSLRMGHINQVHQQSIQAIPAKTSTLRSELQNLQRQIQAVGLGANPPVEDQYLELLEDLYHLEGSWDMAEKQSPEPEAIPDDLQKAIAYGQMLLDVYGGRSLLKVAAVDLQDWGEFLSEQPYQVAQRIGAELLAIAPPLEKGRKYQGTTRTDAQGRVWQWHEETHRWRRQRISKEVSAPATDAQPKAGSLPQRRPLEDPHTAAMLQKWDTNAWVSAPQELQNIINSLPRPQAHSGKTLTGKAKWTDAFWQNDRIFMGRFFDPKKSQMVWRHEYGHHVDAQIAPLIQKRQMMPHIAVGKKFLDQEAQEFGKEIYRELSSFEDLENLTQKLQKESKDLEDYARLSAIIDFKEKLLEKLQLPSKYKFATAGDRLYFSVGASLNNVQNPDSIAGFYTSGNLIKARFYSDSDEFHQLMQADNEYLLKRAALTESKDKDYGGFGARYSAYTKHLDDEVNNKVGLVEGEAFEAERKRILLERIRQQSKGTLLESFYNRPYFDSLPSRRLISKAMDFDDPTVVARSWDESVPNQGVLIAEDLIGSITLNKVGSGHADSYYKGRINNNEAFANIIAIMGVDGDDVAVLRFLAPNAYQRVESVLKEVSDGLAR